MGAAQLVMLAGYPVDDVTGGAMLTAVTGTANHVRRNRAAWDRWAAGYAGPGVRLWTASQPVWGIWNIAEVQAGLLPADLEGRDSIELGGPGSEGDAALPQSFQKLGSDRQGEYR